MAGLLACIFNFLLVCTWYQILIHNRTGIYLFVTQTPFQKSFHAHLHDLSMSRFKEKLEDFV